MVPHSDSNAEKEEKQKTTIFLFPRKRNYSENWKAPRRATDKKCAPLPAPPCHHSAFLPGLPAWCLWVIRKCPSESAGKAAALLCDSSGEDLLSHCLAKLSAGEHEEPFLFWGDQDMAKIILGSTLMFPGLQPARQAQCLQLPSSPSPSSFTVTNDLFN